MPGLASRSSHACARSSELLWPSLQPPRAAPPTDEVRGIKAADGQNLLVGAAAGGAGGGRWEWTAGCATAPRRAALQSAAGKQAGAAARPCIRARLPAQQPRAARAAVPQRAHASQGQRASAYGLKSRQHESAG